MPPPTFGFIATPSLLTVFNQALRDDLDGFCDNVAGATYKAAVRNTFWPIYKQSRHPPDTRRAEQLAFKKHFNHFLANDFPHLEFVDTDVLGYTTRPDPGCKAVIRISTHLAEALLRAHRCDRKAVATRAYFVLFAITIYHELAHVYGYTCNRSDPAPQLAPSGDMQNRVMLNPKLTLQYATRGTTGTMGEEGRLQEEEMAGGILYGVYDTGQTGFEGLRRLQLKVGDHYYDIPDLVVHKALGNLVSGIALFGVWTPAGSPPNDSLAPDERRLRGEVDPDQYKSPRKQVDEGETSCDTSTQDGPSTFNAQLASMGLDDVGLTADDLVRMPILCGTRQMMA